MPRPARAEVDRVTAAGRLGNLGAPANVVGQHAEPQAGGREIGLQVAHGVLHPVHDGIVAEVGPAVVHVEHRDVDDVRIGGRQVAVALDARVLAPAVLGCRRAVGQADVAPVLHAVLAVEGHVLSPPAARRRRTGSGRRPDVTLASPVLLSRVRNPATRPRKMYGARSTSMSRITTACGVSTIGNTWRLTGMRRWATHGAGAARDGVIDGGHPLALVLLPPEDDAGAAEVVVRLDDELVAMPAQVLEQIDRRARRWWCGPAPPAASTARARGPAPVRRGVSRCWCASSVSTAKNAFLCGILQRKVFATQTARSAYAREQRRAVVPAREDVVDQHAPVDEVDDASVRPPACRSRTRAHAGRRPRSAARGPRSGSAGSRTRSTSARRGSRR